MVNGGFQAAALIVQCARGAAIAQKHKTQPVKAGLCGLTNI